MNGNDGRGRVYRERGERHNENCVLEVDRFRSISVMVWAGISLHLKTQMVVINGILNAARCQNEILRPGVFPLMRQNRCMQLKQDGTPSHTARMTTNVLTTNRVNVMPWPSRSLDLNPTLDINLTSPLKQKM